MGSRPVRRVLATENGDSPVRASDSRDDCAQHVRQLRRDQSKSLLVRLRGGDLQERNGLPGGGELVADEAVMPQLEEFLDADAGVPQDLDGSPLRECAALLTRE